MKRTKKPAPTEVELLAKELEHAIYRGEKPRPQLDRIFTGQHADRWYVGASDGHRMALIRTPREATEFTRSDGPPFAQVVPWKAPRVGTLYYDGFREARALPRSWHAILTLHRTGAEVQVSCKEKRTDKHPGLYPFGRKPLSVEWGALEDIAYPIGVALPYLLDALHFIGTTKVHAFNDGPLDPLVLVAPGQTPSTAACLACIMPVRL